MPCRSADYCIYDEEEVFDYSTYPRPFDSPLILTDEIDMTFDAVNITDEIGNSGSSKFSSIFITAPITIADTVGIIMTDISCYCIKVTCKSEGQQVCSVAYNNLRAKGDLIYSTEKKGYIAGDRPSQVIIYDKHLCVYAMLWCTRISCLWDHHIRPG